jgi:hypothetical protein
MTYNGDTFVAAVACFEMPEILSRGTLFQCSVSVDTISLTFAATHTHTHTYTHTQKKTRFA